MALIKCGECGNEISSGAMKCPKCGAATMAAYVTIVVTVLIFGLAAAMYLAGVQMQGH